MDGKRTGWRSWLLPAGLGASLGLLASGGAALAQVSRFGRDRATPSLFRGGSGLWGAFGDSPVGALVLLGGVAVIFVFLARARRASEGSARGSFVVPSASWADMDVTLIELGLSWRARDALERELRRLARAGGAVTPDSLVALLRGVVSCLRRAEVSWLYAAAQNERPMPAERAQEVFRRATADRRARAARAGASDRGRPGSQGADGEGVVVLTLAVVARRELKDIQNPRDAAELRAALGELTRLGPGDLAAVELIWSPAEEGARLSLAALETVHPELALLDETSVAARVFCDRCQGPYAAELAACPHCGEASSPEAGGAS